MNINLRQNLLKPFDLFGRGIEETDSDQPKGHGWLVNQFAKLIELIPILVPLSLALFGTVAIVLLLMGRLDNNLTWPLGLLAALIGCIVVWRKYKVTCWLTSMKAS